MFTRREIVALVRENGEVEPSEGTIWLNQAAPEVWLLEVLPKIPEDTAPWPPFVFDPSVRFPYTQHLVVGPAHVLARAIEAHLELAELVAAGDVIVDSPAVRRLLDVAFLATARAAI